MHLHQGVMEALLYRKALTQSEPCFVSGADGFKSRCGLAVQVAAYAVSPGPALRRQRVSCNRKLSAYIDKASKKDNIYMSMYIHHYH